MTNFEISKAPPGATHWAPENEAWLAGWYRLQEGLWYFVSDYWASDVKDRPYGMPAKAWYTQGTEKVSRPISDLVELKGEKIFYAYVSKGGNLYSTKLSAVKNGEQSLAEFYEFTGEIK